MYAVPEGCMVDDAVVRIVRNAFPHGGPMEGPPLKMTRFGEFCRLSSKNCLVDLKEVILELRSPVDVQTSSSRAGKLLFDVKELQPFIDTLQQSSI